MLRRVYAQSTRRIYVVLSPFSARGSAVPSQWCPSRFRTTSTTPASATTGVKLVGDEIDVNIETDLDHHPHEFKSPSGLAERQASSGRSVLPGGLSLPSPINAQHSDMATFLAHASHTGLSRSSTTYRGTHYEYLTALTLRRYGFNLVRVGGRGDDGVDLVGTWTLPCSTTSNTSTSLSSSAAKSSMAMNDGGGGGGDESSDPKDSAQPPTTNYTSSPPDPPQTPTPPPPQTQTLRVLVQCKRLTGKSSKLGPNLVRELEGALRASSVPTGWRGPGVLGVLVGPRAATKGVRAAIAKSSRAMVWVLMDPPAANAEEVHEVGVEEEGHEVVAEVSPDLDRGGSEGYEPVVAEISPAAGPELGKVCQMLWNRAAGQLGLEGLSVVARHGDETRVNVVGRPGLGGEDDRTPRQKEVVLMWQGRKVVEWL